MREVGGAAVRTGDDVREALERVRGGGEARYHEKARAEGKLFCRERLARLLDEGSFVEDAALANALARDLPADGVVTGTGRIAGRTVCVMANDSTVKAGSSFCASSLSMSRSQLGLPWPLPQRVYQNSNTLWRGCDACAIRS